MQKCKFHEIGILRYLMNWETFVFFPLLFSPFSDYLVNSSPLLLFSLLPLIYSPTLCVHVSIKMCDSIDFYEVFLEKKIKKVAKIYCNQHVDITRKKQIKSLIYLFLFWMCLLKMSERHDSQKGWMWNIHKNSFTLPEHIKSARLFRLFFFRWLNRKRRNVVGIRVIFNLCYALIV